jgi:pilus assembly protein CpaB
MIFGLVLLLGLGLAGFAVYMAQDYISATEEQLARERAARAAVVPVKDVYVVTRAVRYGERIAKEDVKVVQWPENAIPEGVFTTEEELFPEGDRELRTVLRAMEASEAVLAVKVTDPGEDAGVSSRLGAGMRAFALRVDVASGVSGFLRPGDRVDVFWTGQIDSEAVGSREVTQLIQQQIKLIAVDQSADGDRNSPTVARTVTVEATPKQVGILAQAQATGRLQLSLVGSGEEIAVADEVVIDQRDLLGRQAPTVQVREEEKVCTTIERKGTEVVEKVIDCDS